MQISPFVGAPTQPRSSTTVTSTVPPTNPGIASIEGKANVDRFDFDKMTVGQFADALSELIFSGRISVQDATDMSNTTFFSCPTGMSFEDYLNLPMDISYDRIREQIECADAKGLTQEGDICRRGLGLLMRLQGTPRRLDATA